MKYKKHRVIRKIARLLKNFLSRRSVYIERAVEPQNIINLVQRLRPVKTRFDLIRVGGSADGGYLLPDDLADIEVCFSPGVAGTATFEMDLLKNRGINSHLADFSVAGPPAGFQPASFTKKFIGTVNDEMFITLDQWVGDQMENVPGKDLLLQMDIEGWEYPTLLSTTVETLKRFRIIVLELHDIESWGHPHFFRIADALFAKLLTHFHVVHNHPNNFCGTINLGGFEAPRVIEITLLRKDRSEVRGFCTEFPHHLDVPNVEKYKDIPLPKDWYQLEP
ncbi:MAG: FkbM family methyltransferase [Rhodoferax sp.]|nr:FkbM family methyltransferase [Rhodoferax sp.]